MLSNEMAHYGYCSILVVLSLLIGSLSASIEDRHRHNNDFANTDDDGDKLRHDYEDSENRHDPESWEPTMKPADGLTPGEQWCKTKREAFRAKTNSHARAHYVAGASFLSRLVASTPFADPFDWLPKSDEQLRAEWDEAELERHTVLRQSHQDEEPAVIGANDDDDWTDIAQRKVSKVKRKLDPVIDLIRQSGFKVRQYYTKSKDGYVMRLLNVVNPKATRRLLKRPPVVIGHGLSLTYSAFIIQSLKTVAPQPYPFVDGDTWRSSNRSLALYLSNHGFDVWLISARGSDWYSRSYDPKRLKHPYWDFSLDEQGLYDIPAHIDRVLELTKQEKVIYVGYSESTLFMFIQLIENPEFNNKIAAFFALAPIANMRHVAGISSFVSPLAATTMPQLDIEFFPPELHELYAIQSSTVCRLPVVRRGCQLLLEWLVGWSRRTAYEWQVWRHKWRPTSLKAWLHFAQLTKAGRLSTFERWDDCPSFAGCTSIWSAFGCWARAAINGLHWWCNRHVPSRSYNFSRYTHPRTYLYVGMEDALATCEDVTDLYVDLKEHAGIKALYIDDWNHLDLLFAYDVDRKLNVHILDTMNRIAMSIEPQFNSPIVHDDGDSDVDDDDDASGHVTRR